MLVPLLIVGLLVIGAVLLAIRGYLTADEPIVLGPVDTLPDQVMVASRPKPTLSLPQKIIRHRVPARITVSKGRPDTSLVRRFALAVRRADSLQQIADSLRNRGDSAEARTVLGTVPRILPSASGQYDGKTFQLWMSRSDGSIMRATVRLKPHWTFVAGVDHTTEQYPAFTEDRWWLRTVRKTVRCVPRGAVLALPGALIDRSDRLRGALLSGGSALLGCLVG